MKVVQPIRDKAVLTRCFEISRAHDAQRKEEDKLSWELLLVVGFNTSFRISDLVRLKVKDVRGQDFVRVTAQKTGKEARIAMNGSVRATINRLTAGRGAGEWLFLSRQKDGKTMGPRAISRQRANFECGLPCGGREGKNRLPHDQKDIWLSLLQAISRSREAPTDSWALFNARYAGVYWHDRRRSRRELAAL